MDPVVPTLEKETRRRRRRPLFRHARVPVRMLVPNFFTLLGLCAGLTSIRMGIEGRYDMALAAIVFAACLDGLDGRIARLLKASSRFGAELDSLADFVNFGVAPAFLLFNWGLLNLKLGWVCVMMFALGSALRLARFNAAIDDDKPKWQSNFFTGMPTPAAAIAVLLPVYIHALGFEVMKQPYVLTLVLLYTLTIAIMMVSTIPTYSGKLLGERVEREWVLPIFVVAIGFVAMLATYPYETLAVATMAYLASIPVSWRRFHDKAQQAGASGSGDDDAIVDQNSAPVVPPVVNPGVAQPGGPPATGQAAQSPAQATSRVYPLRPGEPPR